MLSLCFVAAISRQRLSMKGGSMMEPQVSEAQHYFSLTWDLESQHPESIFALIEHQRQMKLSLKWPLLSYKYHLLQMLSDVMLRALRVVLNMLVHLKYEHCPRHKSFASDWEDRVGSLLGLFGFLHLHHLQLLWPYIYLGRRYKNQMLRYRYGLLSRHFLLHLLLF